MVVAGTTSGQGAVRLMTLDKESLEGDYVRLEPLSEMHRGELIEAISDGKS